MSIGNMQLPLFSGKEKGSFPPPLVRLKEIKGSSPLSLALGEYFRYLSLNYSSHTAKSFTSDIRLLIRFLGPEKRIEEVSTQDLQEFLYWLKERKGQPQSPKTLSRRVTALKNFFGWLNQKGIISENPAARLIYKRATPPLPEILSETECQRLILEASKDPRDYLIILLLLETGLKKAELLNIQEDDIDLSNQYRPEIIIRHRNPNKQRRLKLPPEFAPTYKAYIKKYNPKEKLFPFSERNLSYILSSLAQRAGIKKKVSAQILRDTFAVRQLRQGEDINKVLRKLGLTPGPWSEEAKQKYLKLAEPAL